MGRIRRIYRKHRLLANSPGIALRRSRSGQFLLGTAGSPDNIGSFDSAAEAWKALDAVDLAEVDARFADRNLADAA